MARVLLSLERGDGLSEPVDLASDFTLLDILVRLVENHALGEAIDPALDIGAALLHDALRRVLHLGHLAFPSVHLIDLGVSLDRVEELNAFS